MARHHGADRLRVSAGGRFPRQRVRHLRHPKSPLPADPSDAAYGPARRHLEAAGVRGLRSQQGGVPTLVAYSECVFRNVPTLI